MVKGSRPEEFPAPYVFTRRRLDGGLHLELNLTRDRYEKLLAKLGTDGQIGRAIGDCVQVIVDDPESTFRLVPARAS